MSHPCCNFLRGLTSKDRITAHQRFAGTNDTESLPGTQIYRLHLCRDLKVYSLLFFAAISFYKMEFAPYKIPTQNLFTVQDRTILGKCF